MSIFLFFLVVMPFLIAGAMYIMARVLPDLIDYLYDFGKGWGGIVLIWPVLFVAWAIRYRYGDRDEFDMFPIRQLSTALGWWSVGVIPSVVWYFVVWT